MAYEMMNQDQKALEDYRKTLEIDPDNFEAMENLAGIYENKGAPVTEAIKLYNGLWRLTRDRPGKMSYRSG